VKQKIYLDTLPEGYCLHWYELKSVIGRGGYGITYLALDKNLDRMVAIKEYLPTDFAARDSNATVRPVTGEKGEIYNWGLDRFLKEARTLAKFTHPNIVRVLSVFEQNNTAYMVMEYEHGSNLAKLYKNTPYYAEQQLLDVFIPILDGLILVHDAGFIHRDIKPANIYIRENNTPVLLDFGSARRTSGGLTHALTSLVTFGYAPFEQYNESGGKQGPWTDIYSIGATMYLGISGKLPIDAMARGGSYINNEADPYEPISEKAAGKYSPELLLAIDNALFFRAEERPQDALSWMNMLLGKATAMSLPGNMSVSQIEGNDDDHTVIMPKGGKAKPVTAGHSKRFDEKSDAEDGTLVSSSNIYQKPLSQRITPPSHVTTPPRKAWQDDFYYQSEQNDKLSNIKQTVTELLKHQKSPLVLTGLAVLFVAVVIIWAVLPDGGTETRSQDTVAQSELQQTATKGPASESTSKSTPSQATETEPAILPSQTDIASDRSSEISRLLERAESDFSAGRIIQPQGDSAVYHYLTVLDSEPNNERAIQGIDKILTFYSNAVKSFLSVGDVKEAEKNVKIMEAISRDSSITQQVRSQFEMANQSSAQTLALLGQAQDLLTKKQYTTPVGKNAYELFRKVLNIDPNNQKAKDGIAQIVEYYETKIKKYIKSNNAQMAKMSLARLKTVTPDSKNIAKWNANINELLKSEKNIKFWLTKAQLSFASNKVSKPTNDSALFWYRRVLKIQPKNKKANDGLENILAYYQKKFNSHITAYRFTSAKSVQKTVGKIAPKSKTYKKMKMQLAKSSGKKRANKPQIEVISELIGKYKYALEAQDIKKMKSLSAVSPSREKFMNNLFKQYKKFKVNVSGVKYIGRENRATARVSLVDLINKNGEPVKPGQWSKFDIVVRKNSKNHWTIFW